MIFTLSVPKKRKKHAKLRTKEKKNFRSAVKSYGTQVKAIMLSPSPLAPSKYDVTFKHFKVLPYVF